MDHTFAIPVYGSAPNLGGLLASLRAQEGESSEILIATSTPSSGLAEFAERQQVRLLINPRRIDIANDWNFALGAARTRFVTLAHQDDLYAPAYKRRLSAALQRHARAVISFCDYTEHTSRGTRPVNLNLRIKRALSRRAFRARECLETRRDKEHLLRFGNPICCPSVMFNRATLGDFRFPEGFQSNLDWMAWVELARRAGGFVYVRDPLLSKGVHVGSETSVAIANHARLREDARMFGVFWPKPVAACLARLYRLGYRANRVE